MIEYLFSPSLSQTKLNHFLCSMHILKRESSENVGIHLFDIIHYPCSFPHNSWSVWFWRYSSWSPSIKTSSRKVCNRWLYKQLKLPLTTRQTSLMANFISRDVRSLVCHSTFLILQTLAKTRWLSTPPYIVIILGNVGISTLLSIYFIVLLYIQFWNKFFYPNCFAASIVKFDNTVMYR